GDWSSCTEAWQYHDIAISPPRSIRRGPTGRLPSAHPFAIRMEVVVVPDHRSGAERNSCSPQRSSFEVWNEVDVPSSRVNNADSAQSCQSDDLAGSEARARRQAHREVAHYTCRTLSNLEFEPCT